MHHINSIEETEEQQEGREGASERASERGMGGRDGSERASERANGRSDGRDGRGGCDGSDGSGGSGGSDGQWEQMGANRVGRVDYLHLPRPKKEHEATFTGLRIQELADGQFKMFHWHLVYRKLACLSACSDILLNRHWQIKSCKRGQ